MSANGNRLIRQAHRWLSVVFTATVVICFVAATQKEPAAWVFYLPLPPLALLLFSGLYLFVVPYAARWRKARPLSD